MTFGPFASSSATHKNAPLPVLQEVVAGAGHGGAAIGFALALAAQASAEARHHRRRSIAWVRQDAATAETGDAYGLGLSIFGSDPGDFLIVQTRTFADTLRAGLEAVRCSTLVAVLIETTAALDLTSSRRLKLAAEKSGVATFLIRHTNASAPNAASLRWHIKAARHPGGTQARGPCLGTASCFDVTLSKHPNGLAGLRWQLEWDHEARSFRETLPLSVAAVPVGRPLAA